MIETVPLETPVTKPVLDTVAMLAFEEDQEKVPEDAWPFTVKDANNCEVPDLCKFKVELLKVITRVFVPEELFWSEPFPSLAFPLEGWENKSDKNGVKFCEFFSGNNNFRMSGFKRQAFEKNKMNVKDMKS